MFTNNHVAAPSDGDIDINYHNELTEAGVTLEGYVDPETLRPRFAIDTSRRVEEYASANNVPMGLALTKWQEGLKRLVCDEVTRLDRGRISLDVDGIFGGRLWSCPPVHGEPIPQICFAGLRATSPLFKKGEVEAVAVYYLPGRRVVAKVNQTTGLPYEVSDDYEARGYLGIVQTFDSVPHAEDAMIALERGVRFFQRPTPSAYIDDEETNEVVPPRIADII